MLQKNQNIAQSSNATSNQGWWWIDQNKLGISELPENSIGFAVKTIDTMLVSL